MMHPVPAEAHPFLPSGEGAPGLAVPLAGLKTGDLVFFHGEGAFTSTIIELSGMSPWSHVALVVDYCQPGTSTTCRAIWEATSWHANQKDLIDHDLRGGARLVDLAERLASTRHGTVAVRQLHLAEGSGGGGSRVRHSLNDVHMHIDRFISAQNGKPYEASWFPLVRSWFDVFNACGGCRNHHDTSAYFCSELVAETLMQAGVLAYQAGRPSDEFTVADMACLHNGTDLVAPYTYGAIANVTWCDPPAAPPLAVASHPRQH